MTTEPRRPFNRRAFTAAMMALTGVSLPISGLFNHLHQFDPLTVTRHGWMAAHNALAILFAVFAGWHIALNRRVLWNHFQHLPEKTVSREAMLAGAIVVAVLAVAVGHAFLPTGPHE